MPYTAKNAPSYVKRMPSKQRDAWVKVWNSAYDHAVALPASEQKKKLKNFDGKKTIEQNAEAYAFAVANAAGAGTKQEREELYRAALMEGRSFEVVLLNLCPALELEG